MKKMLGLILGLALVTGSVALAQDTGKDGKKTKASKAHKGGKKSKKGSSTGTTPPPK